jgi:protein-S-isoprenylcysteine O-methyltransferase Ste14
MSIKNRLQRWLKLRFAILYPFTVFVVIFANCNDESIRFGIWFILAGLFMRIWANGYAIKLEKLTTSGPYAFVRHPLYLGTLFLVFGSIIILRIYYIGMLLVSIIIVIYNRTIKKEEQMLKNRFKHLYISYMNKVPTIVPTIFPYREGEKWPFSIKRLVKSKEYKVLIWMTIMLIAFHLKEEFLIEKERINTKIIVLIVAAFLLGMADLISELIKKKRIKF